MSSVCEDCGKVSIISNITLCEDCYRKELEASKKQGALKELKRIESIICNFDFSKLNTDCFVKTNKYIGRIAEYINNKREELQGVEQK